MNKIKNWIEQYPYLAVICISMLFMDKSMISDNFGYFLLVTGIYMWYTKEKPQKVQLTIDDVEEIARDTSYLMVSTYMTEFFKPIENQQFEGDAEGFDPDTFPPFEQQNPFDEDNPFSEN